MATQTQQFALYAAEESAPLGRSFESISEIQTFVDSLRDTFWWAAQNYWTITRIEVGRPSPAKEKGGSVGWYDKGRDAGRIEMAKVHWHERDVLHEVAHVIAAAKHGSKAHDPYFARVYAILVCCVMGPEAWLALSSAFETHGINYLQETPS